MAQDLSSQFVGGTLMSAENGPDGIQYALKQGVELGIAGDLCNYGDITFVLTRSNHVNIIHPAPDCLEM